MDKELEYKTEWYYPLNNNEESTDPAPKKKTGMMGMMQKVNPFKVSPKPGVKMDQNLAAEDQEPKARQNPGAFAGMMQKVNPFKLSTETRKNDFPSCPREELNSDKPTASGSAENESKENPGVFKGMIQKVNPFKSSVQTEKYESYMAPQGQEKTFPSSEELSNNKEAKQPQGMFVGVIQRVNPFKAVQQAKYDEPLVDPAEPEGRTRDEEKQNPGMFRGVMQKVNPFKSTNQESQSLKSSSSNSSSSLVDNDMSGKPQGRATDGGVQHSEDAAERKKKRRGTFVIRRMLPGALFGSASKDSEHELSGAGDKQSDVQEAVELVPVEIGELMTSQGDLLDSEDDEDGLLSWWRTVEGWDEWNESTHFDEGDEELAVEAAADRVFMAARLFVRLFNRRGASLQQRILDLLAVADSADAFHKKTVTASVGGGVASVAGSVTTITGLVLAPFTMGTSLIVTAVGIGVATAGGVASASANITDTVHSKTDRKKVEKMIQDYQEEIKDIKECLDFLQTGMETLEEWHFEQYMETLAKHAMNQDVKHVMKEGGRAGKALAINAESLMSTVQVLSVAGGAAKAAQVMSVTTGVMSGLFLALDVFFLAKDSAELHKGARTEFAAKLREVCKDLQDGLLELNRIKEELQKTMDGIEVDVEEEEDEDDDDDSDEEEEKEEVLKSDPMKLAQLEE